MPGPGQNMISPPPNVSMAGGGPSAIGGGRMPSGGAQRVSANGVSHPGMYVSGPPQMGGPQQDTGMQQHHQYAPGMMQQSNAQQVSYYPQQPGENSLFFALSL